MHEKSDGFQVFKVARLKTRENAKVFLYRSYSSNTFYSLIELKNLF